MKKETLLLIDFDNTFVTVESLDQLARIVLAEKEDRNEKLAEIVKLTNLGMEGKITFSFSLGRRLALFMPTRKHIEILIMFLKQHVSLSIQKNKYLFQQNAKTIFIISGGFKEYIVPIVREYGISPTHVFANTFLFDTKGSVIGYDQNNFLAHDKGKVNIVKSIFDNKGIVVVGDGYTDYEIKKSGLASQFFLFTENVQRKNLYPHADYIVKSFTEVIYKL
jgi:D-3-phosphoglycerate dehydrogenase